MGIIRFLLAAIFVMLILLVIVPRTAKDKELEQKTFRWITGVCIVLGIFLGISIYQFKDILLSDPPSQHPTFKAIIQNQPQAKHLQLSSFLLKNFTPNALQEALEKNTNIEVLVLKEITPEMIKVITSSLQQHPHLHTIEAKALSLKSMQTLLEHWQSLPVHTLILKNYSFGDQICLWGAKWMQNSKIEHLHLENNQISDAASADLARWLGHNPTLKTLILKENNLNDNLSKEFGSAIASLQQLESLDLSLNQLGTTGIELLAPGLIQTTQLKKLNLSYNQLDDEAFIALATVLKQQRSIEDLELQRNQFSDQGALAIAEALTVNTSLKRIVIRSKRMTKKGEQALKATLNVYPNRTIELGMTRTEKSFRDEP